MYFHILLLGSIDLRSPTMHAPINATQPRDPFTRTITTATTTVDSMPSLAVNEEGWRMWEAAVVAAAAAAATSAAPELNRCAENVSFHRSY